MPDAAQTGLLPAREVARSTPLATAANGLHYASFGYTEVPSDSLSHIVEAVPPSIAEALARRAYYFVPLAIGETGETEETEVARGFTADLGDRATCHRNVLADGVECTFISARLMQDRFALAFEFFINIGHQMVDAANVPRVFEELVWAQARAEVRGETSQDAYEARARALEPGIPEPNIPEPSPLEVKAESSFAGQSSEVARHSSVAPESGTALSLFAIREPRSSAGSGSSFRGGRPRLESSRAPGLRPEPEASSEDKTAFFEAAFADTLAIYMLSLAMDLDYADLREREYPLLAAPALADRLRLAAELFPPPPGYEFQIRYRRRH